MVNRECMEKQLALHEGLRLYPYRCTAKKLTLGVGYNGQDRGWETFERIIGRPLDRALLTRAERTKERVITRPEALVVLRADIQTYEAAVRKAWPFYDTIDEVRQRVVLDMAFNLGYRLRAFKNTQRAVEQRQWTLAAAHMMQSLWSMQVGDGPGKIYDRAERLKDMMLTGRDYVLFKAA